jgi:hypothetical protein
MKIHFYILGCFMLFAGIGCKKDIPVSSTEPNASKSADGQQVNTETLLRDQIVQPIGKVIRGQIYVENSDPVNPTAPIDIIDGSSSPLQVLVSGVTVEEVRWKVNGPFMSPKYPAAGFITVTLAENQWKLLDGKSIIVKETNGK